MNRRRLRIGLLVASLATAVALGLDRGRDPAIGKTYQIPYRLTDTNHFLVRVRINGKGPFNFLVDTGAPALYISTDTAKKIDLVPAKGRFWTPVKRLDFEGGATLSDVKARIEDPFQLVGMNALGLPGASIDGILGFTILARFRLELDPTRDRMTWTRLDYDPRDPPIPDHAAGGAPGEVQAMNTLGPIAKFAAALMGKQPEEQLHPRGFFGLELAEVPGGVNVTRVVDGSPASKAGVHAGDRLLRILDRDGEGPRDADAVAKLLLPGRSIDSLKTARAIAETAQSGDHLVLIIRRGSERLEIPLIAGEGF
jgi:hypothetical protein